MHVAWLVSRHHFGPQFESKSHLSCQGFFWHLADVSDWPPSFFGILWISSVGIDPCKQVSSICIAVPIHSPHGIWPFLVTPCICYGIKVQNQPCLQLSSNSAHVCSTYTRIGTQVANPINTWPATDPQNPNVGRNCPKWYRAQDPLMSAPLIRGDSGSTLCYFRYKHKMSEEEEPT